MDQACPEGKTSIVLPPSTAQEITDRSQICLLDPLPLGATDRQTGQPAASEDSAQSLERCEETAHGVSSDTANMYLERQFASHTEWLQLLASRPAFISRLDLRALARLSSLLSSAKLAVDSAAEQGSSEVKFARGSSSRKGSAWEHLPPGIFCGITSRLPPDSAATARRACVGWSKELGQNWVQLRPSTLPPQSWSSSFCNLQSLDLWQCREYRLSWDDARRLTELKELRMPGNTTDKELQAVCRIRTLTTLSISRCYDVRAMPPPVNQHAVLVIQ
jgi:hypothetical protein